MPPGSRLVTVVLLALVAACSDGQRCQDDVFRCGELEGTDEGSSAEESTGSTEDVCFGDGPGAIVRIENRTGNAIEVVYFVRCDGSDASEFPLMPPGLANGEDVELPLPGPGCWLLDYSGEGCEGTAPHETEMQVCIGDTYVWTPDDLHHECAG